MKIENNGIKKFIRGCSNIGSCNGIMCYGFNSYKTIMNFCTTDLCNNATNLVKKIDNIFRFGILITLISLILI